MARREYRSTAAIAAMGIATLALTGCASGLVDDTVRDGAGTITEAGELGAFKLQVGDCVNDPSMLAYSEEDFDEVISFDAVPCSRTHTGEVVMVNDDFFAGEQELPSVEVIDAQAS